jgi:hypothetical protein
MRVGQKPTSTVAQVIREIHGSGLHIPDPEDFKRNLLCPCERCVRDKCGPLNGHPVCAITNGRQIFFIREDCAVEEGYQPIKVKAGPELKKLITATFDEKFVRPKTRQREAAAC